MRNNVLDLLRIFAAALVLVTHSIRHVLFLHDKVSHEWTRFGDIGVDIFFILSGYFISVSLENSDNIASYIKKRVIRVIPIYWLYLLVLIVYQGKFDFTVIFNNMLLLPKFSDGHFNHLLGPAWTLSYEIYFYIVSGVFFIRRKLLDIFIAIVGLNIVGFYSESMFLSNTLQFEFIYGIAIYRLGSFKVHRIKLLVIGLLVLFIPLNISTNQIDWWRFLIYGLPAAYLVCAMKDIPLGYNRYISLGAESSYNLYLTHMVLAFPLLRQFVWYFDLGIWNSFLVAIIIAYSISIFTTLYLDRRIYRILRGL